MLFLITEGSDVNAVDELGSTPLHLAALFTKDKSLVRSLLKNGSNLEAVDYKGSTPLLVGCSSGSKEAISVMIDHGR